MVSGIRNTRLVALAAAGAFAGSMGLMGVPIAPNPRSDRLSREIEARDRARRRQAREEERERALRAKISEGGDDRPDKYLHAAARRRREAAARRRREAERAASLAPATETSGA